MADFDPFEFVAVVLELTTLKVPNPQAYWRTAAGRAYYAAYGLIRKNLQVRHSHNFGTAGKHRQPIGALVSDPRKIRLVEVAGWMKQLMDARAKADYQWQGTSNLSEIDALDANEAASKVAELLGKPTPGDWATIDQGI